MLWLHSNQAQADTGMAILARCRSHRQAKIKTCVSRHQGNQQWQSSIDTNHIGVLIREKTEVNQYANPYTYHAASVHVVA
jgi:hypothetical protein